MRIIGTVALTIFALQGAALGMGISAEDFEAGAVGWNDFTLDNTHPETFTEFLGRHGAPDGTGQVVWKDFELPNDQTQVVIEFDLYEIDSWDGGEVFNVYIDDAVVASDARWGARPNAVRTSAYGADLGFASTAGGAAWNWDSVYHYSFTYATSDSGVKLGFGSTLNSPISNESWGVDNVVISDNYVQAPHAPEPITAAGVFMALGCLGAYIRRRRVA